MAKKTTPRISRRETLRIQAVVLVLQREVDTGHMTPKLAKTLLERMDQAFVTLTAPPPPTPPETAE